MKVITIEDNFGVIPIFSVDVVLRLTENGELETSELTICQLFNKHMKLFAEGRALCSPPDYYDPFKGMRIALGRALDYAKTQGMLDGDEAAHVRVVLEQAIGNAKAVRRSRQRQVVELFGDDDIPFELEDHASL